MLIRNHITPSSMRHGIITLAIIICTFSFGIAVANAWEPLSSENKSERYALQIESLLQKQYGSNFESKIQKLHNVQSKILSLNNPKLLPLLKACELAETSIIQENLELYIRVRYLNNNIYKKDDFREAYASLQSIDPKASISPSYMASIEKHLRNDLFFHENSRDFRALVYLSFVIQENIRTEPTYQEKTSLEWTTAWRDLRSPKVSKISGYQKIAQAVSGISNINPYSSDDLSYMKQVIWSEKISPDSYYFKAYAYMRYALDLKQWRIELSTPFEHVLQTQNLSCESNSATDLINFYRIRNGFLPIVENEFIKILPIRDVAMARVKVPGRAAKFVWGDPDKYFVGNINGKQSSNRMVFTGYGIHADGIAPVINNALHAESLEVKKDRLDEGKILESLANGDPIMFWYLLPINVDGNGTKKYATSPISWETPEGKTVYGYIWQHVGLIMGADFDASGHITTVSFYQGKNKTLETSSFGDIQKTADLFHAALYVQKKESVTTE